MPIYEYACPDCGTAFERRLKLDERSGPQVCPSCGGTGAELRMSMPGLVGASASRSSSGAVGTCPSTGEPCGCGRAHRH